MAVKKKQPKKKPIKDIVEQSTLKQEIFCQEWVDTIGNGTLASLKAFDIKDKDLLEVELPPRPKDKKQILKWEKENEITIKRRKQVYSTASNMASEYLRKPYIIKRIDEILEERGFNDEAVKRQHFKLLTGSKDEVSIRAVDSYYRLKGKFIDKSEITGLNGGAIEVKYKELTDEELKEQYAKRIKA